MYPEIVDECKTHKTSLFPENSDDEDDANISEPENIIKNFGEETIVEDLIKLASGRVKIPKVVKQD